MKNIRYAALVLALLCLGVSCKKEKNDGDTPQATACNGMNLCFKLNGTSESHNATWKVLNNRYRVLWEEGSGNNYKNIELDMYGTTTGSYAVNANPSAGQAGFQYYINDNGTVKNIQGQSGTVEITAIDGTKITGKFTVTATDGGTNYEITEGNFVAVPQ
ncbi:MAG: hypothetical protein JNL72_08505 [Flavipsychrobacter sp.]|nr:hypothetical protein [Flavipsychrobacter sp.]